MRASDRMRISSRQHLDRAGRELGVHGLRPSARATLPTHRQHVLAAHAVGRGVRLRRDLRPRHHLAEPLAVAQVDEDHAAQVAPRGRPAHQRDRLRRPAPRAARRSSACASGRRSRLSHGASPAGSSCTSSSGTVFLRARRAMSRTVHDAARQLVLAAGWPRSARPACRPASSATSGRGPRGPCSTRTPGRAQAALQRAGPRRSASGDSGSEEHVAAPLGRAPAAAASPAAPCPARSRCR